MSKHTHNFEPAGGLAVECDCGIYLEGSDLISSVENSFQIEELKHINAEMLEALEGLKTGDCWCGKGIDDPRMRNHSTVCLNVRAAIAKAKGESKSPVTS